MTLEAQALQASNVKHAAPLPIDPRCIMRIEAGVEVSKFEAGQEERTQIVVVHVSVGNLR